MKAKKLTGSYYTPEYLSGFIMRYLAHNFKTYKYLSILEPSVGDGSFVKAFNETVFPKTIKKFAFTAIDKIKPEIKKAQLSSKSLEKKNCTYKFFRADFLSYQNKISNKFDLIVGNPPYISKQLLGRNQKLLCEQIHTKAGLLESSVKNIWSAFLVRCSQLVNDNGVLAFVLPAELLQLKFTQELRVLLSNIFERTEIFTFSELLFDCKGQDTILFIGYKRHDISGQFYTHILNTEQLACNDFVLAQNLALGITDTKWTHHNLLAEDLHFIHAVGHKLNNIDYYCESKPGIVTAANKFFIVDSKTERLYHLTKYLKPIIQKGLYVNGGITFGIEDFDNLVKEGKPTQVLVLNNDENMKFPAKINEYLNIGIKMDLPNRYKCSKRDHWYVIPNISVAPEGFFLRRVYQYPKLIRNDAKVLITDSAYKIEMREGFEIDSLIYSFYNSLTLLFAEIQGRYYGGGVLELTPREFKKLPIPNAIISKHKFAEFAKCFQEKSAIQEILLATDYEILNCSIGLSAEETDRVKAIYKKLVVKRFRLQ